MPEKISETRYLLCREGIGNPAYQSRMGQFLREWQTVLEAGNIMEFLKERRVGNMMFPLTPNDIYILSKHKSYDEVVTEMSKQKSIYENDGFSLRIYEVDIAIERTVKRLKMGENGAIEREIVEDANSRTLDAELGLFLF